MSVLEDFQYQFVMYRNLGNAAMAQVTDTQFFFAPEQTQNSIAVTAKHLGGNLHSRWRDVLTTDGEKPDRNRDGEFVVEGEDRAEVMAVWDQGWETCLSELAKLRDSDLTQEILIRRESHTLHQALLRSVTHASYHVGQIVQRARGVVGDEWQTLSIPRGGSGKALE